MRHTVPWLVKAALLGTTLVLPPSLPQTCTTRENVLLGRMETTCQDGTRIYSRYNELLQRWESTIMEPSRPGKCCTTRVHPVTKQLERWCP